MIIILTIIIGIFVTICVLLGACAENGVSVIELIYGENYTEKFSDINKRIKALEDSVYIMNNSEESK